MDPQLLAASEQALARGDGATAERLLRRFASAGPAHRRQFLGLLMQSQEFVPNA